MGRGFTTRAQADQPCPCGSGASYGRCCGPLHQGIQRAATAEQLMRSRYSAFALKQVDYLIATHPEPGTPVAKRRRELRASCEQTRWLGLRITAVEAGDEGDLQGRVSFEASFSAAGQRQWLKETSLFQRRGEQADGDWLYISALNASAN